MVFFRIFIKQFKTLNFKFFYPLSIALLCSVDIESWFSRNGGELDSIENEIKGLEVCCCVSAVFVLFCRSGRVGEDDWRDG